MGGFIFVSDGKARLEIFFSLFSADKKAINWESFQFSAITGFEFFIIVSYFVRLWQCVEDVTVIQFKLFWKISF